MKKIILTLICLAVFANAGFCLTGSNFEHGIRLGIQAVSPNTSATTTMVKPELLFYNGSTIGTANIVLPTGVRNGDSAKIITKPAITVSTVTAGTVSVNGGATSFSANTAIEYTFSSVTGEWHKSQ